jgi:LPS sulfotransferase NodH
MQNVALNLGIQPGNLNYTRFIILGRSRSGSNFLRGLLNSHSQITVYGEIFQNQQSIGWALPGYRQSRTLMQQFHQEPVRFIETKVFHKFPSQIKAVGFKIFYYHAQDGNWGAVWEYLKDDQSIRVLHIKRRNILKTHLSRVRALQSDHWVNVTGSNEVIQPVVLDYEDCLQDFNRTREWEIESDRLFATHPMLEIYYEDLAKDYQAIMYQVEELLGVAHEKLTPETFQQSSQPLSQSISNYADLKVRFQGTAWEEFFTE